MLNFYIYRHPVLYNMSTPVNDKCFHINAPRAYLFKNKTEARQNSSKSGGNVVPT